jgi:dihydrolipoamide dehydrogenase
VVGSGAIGVEFSSLYHDLGVDVTIVEVMDTIMPAEDAEISSFARKQFEKRGMTIKTSTKVESVDKSEDDVTVTLAGKDGSTETITFDRIIVSAGIVGNIENIGLEEIGVETDRSFIKTDAYCRTNAVGVYAIGDVAGPPCLAHKASHEGVICVEKLVGLDGVHPLDKNQVPGCTYCRPQVASVGMTEAQAKAAGRSIKVGRFNYQGNGKALAIAEGEGFVKTIFDTQSGELLGAHMIGPEVTEQIQGFGIAQSLEATEQELVHTVFAHPTLSEAMHEAVLDACGQALHQ